MAERWDERGDFVVVQVRMVAARAGSSKDAECA